jgi:hypothetical protein
MMTFGIDYTGAPSTTTPVCIAASKAAFTQFVVTGTPGDAALSALLLDRVQKSLDEKLWTVFNPMPLPPGGSARCATWRLLP